MSCILNTCMRWDPRILQRLYQEYLTCNGEWLNSTIVQSAVQSQSITSTGEDTYSTYQDLVKRYGEKVAKQIRAEKRRLQAALPANSTEPPFVMDHPDLPGVED